MGMGLGADARLLTRRVNSWYTLVVFRFRVVLHYRGTLCAFAPAVYEIVSKVYAM